MHKFRFLPVRLWYGYTRFHFNKYLVLQIKTQLTICEKLTKVNNTLKYFEFNLTLQSILNIFYFSFFQTVNHHHILPLFGQRENMCTDKPSKTI